MKIKTAAELRERVAGQTISQQFAAIREAHSQRLDACHKLDSDAGIEGRELKASERREYDGHIDETRRLNVLLQTLEASPEAQRVDRSELAGYGEGFNVTGEYRDGAPLSPDQSMRGFVRARGLVTDEDADQPLSLRKCLRGALFQDWTDAGPELRAMSGLSGAGGGFSLPTVLTAEIIDLARSQTRILEAGARVIPMDSRTVDVAKWVTDPTPGWRAEGAAIPESDGALDKVTLDAKSLAVFTKITRELLEDASEVEDQLRNAFAAGFARKVDLAALYGGGANEPVGLKATAGVTKTPLATNGAAPTWAALVNSVGRLRDANEDPTAIIAADRTWRTLNLLADTTGQYIPAPSYLDGLARLSTSQVPKNLTVGTSADTSDVFSGDFRQLFLGVRTQLQITLSDRFMTESGSFALVGWWRGDVAVARPAAFDIVTGVRP